MNALELAELPIVPDPKMVDEHGEPLMTVLRVKVENADHYVLVCHPDRVDNLRAGLLRDVERLKGRKQ